MRILVALSLVVAAACGSPPKKVEDTIKQDTAQESCCCKSIPMTSEDGQPVYENANNMECSSKQGECVDQVQCQQQNAAEPE